MVPSTPPSAAARPLEDDFPPEQPPRISHVHQPQSFTSRRIVCILDVSVPPIGANWGICVAREPIGAPVAIADFGVGRDLAQLAGHRGIVHVLVRYRCLCVEGLAVLCKRAGTWGVWVCVTYGVIRPGRAAVVTTSLALSAVHAGLRLELTVVAREVDNCRRCIPIWP